MAKITCIIVDDEPLAVSLIKKYVAMVPDLELLGSYHSAMEAYSMVSSGKVDLLFLDINMPELTGMEFIKIIKDGPRVILTTAYREYAIESYEWDVVDYLLKPISFTRFLKAVQKFQQLQSEQVPIAKSSANPPAFIFVNEGRKQVKVVLEEVLYAESMKDYVQIFTTSKRVVTKTTFNDFNKELPSNFLRVHRSYVVNVDHISAFSSNGIELGQIEIPIGISYKNVVMERLS